MDDLGTLTAVVICMLAAIALGLATATLFARATDAHAAELPVEPTGVEGPDLRVR